VQVSQRLSLTLPGKTTEGVAPRSEPESGNPTFRDRREACGNVVMRGAGLRGAADKAADLEGWKSPYRQLPGFGRLAYRSGR
jgi:hypothetical protein